MSSHPTSSDTPNATSSQASAGGPSQPDLLGGPMIESCGPAPRRASRSRLQAKEKPRLTIGTCGPTFSGSPVPEGPLSLWESRLRRRLARTGSTECSLTWKASTTPAGRPLSRLVPSTRPTEGIACGLWPTPCARDHMPAHSMEYIKSKKAQGHGMSILPDYALHAALWPTPTASLADKGVRSTKGAIMEAARNHGPDLAAVTAAALWSTPVADDTGMRTKPYAQGGTALSLMAATTLGLAPTGSSATTEKPGALNPAFVCWLMGFPAALDACAPTAMPSSRRSRRK